MLAWVQFLPYDFDDERLIKSCELRAHDDIIKVLLLDNEVQTVVLDRLKTQFVWVEESLENVALCNLELQILHAKLLQARDVELLSQKVNVHHQRHDFLVEWILKVDDVSINVVQNHLECFWFNARQFYFKLRQFCIELHFSCAKELLEMLIARLFGRENLGLQIDWARCYNSDVSWNFSFVRSDDKDNVTKLFVHEESSKIFGQCAFGVRRKLEFVHISAADVASRVILYRSSENIPTNGIICKNIETKLQKLYIESLMTAAAWNSLPDGHWESCAGMMTDQTCESKSLKTTRRCLKESSQEKDLTY